MNDNEKILISKSLLRITFIMICISVALKLLGLNIFDANNSNKILLAISNYVNKNNINDFAFSFLVLFIQIFIVLRISSKNNKTIIYYISAFICTVITTCVQWLIYVQLNLSNSQLAMFLYFLFSLLLLIITPILIDIKIKENINKGEGLLKRYFTKIWRKIRKPLILFIICALYQLIVLFLRNLTYVARYDSLYNLLLNFDYTILLLFTYYLFLRKDSDVKITSAFDFSLVKLLNERPNLDELRVSINGLKGKLKEFSNAEKSEKIIIVIYIIFFVLSELVNLGLVVLIAFLNNVLIECFFVVSSFFISRKAFGSFHLDSAWKCWIVSNVSFYILNKITVGIDISFVIPILGGILLSFVTSKFIKKSNNKPYRGMSENELKKIYKNKSLNEFEIKLLTDFYCNRESIIKLTIKYNYSEPMIYQFKSQALKKLAI